MKLSLKYFTNFSFLLELGLFTFTLFLALGIALNLAPAAPTQAVSSGSDVFAWQFIIAFLIATGILLLILKYVKRPILLQVLFYLAILEGLWLFSQAYFPWPGYMYVLAFIIFAWLFYNNVAMHNVVIVLSTSAIAVLFGLNISPSTGIIILLFLAGYDFIAVYKTKHMVQMFRGMAESKVHFSLIIPFAYRSLFKKVKDVNTATEFMFLGTGDLALPAIFIVTCLQINILTALITALGSIFGFIFLYIIFVTQNERQPMPGLPPIVLGTLLGFLISFFVR